MPLTTQQRIDTARSLATQLFATATAGQTHDDIVNAVAGADNALDATLNQAVTNFGGATTVISALAQAVPAPAAGSWSAGQKAIIGSYVLMKRAGII
jgi:hypothetical protein